MNKITQISFLALSVVAASVSASEGGVYLSETLGYHMPSKSTSFGNSVAANIGLGIKTDSPWATELTYSIAAPNDEMNDNDATWRNIHLDALYFIEQSARLRPYAALGYGRGSVTTVLGKEKNQAANFGAGVLWEWIPRLDLRADARYFVDSDNSNIDSMLSVGIAYRFFDLLAAKAPVAASTPTPVPLDSDNDGVYDRSDRCPNSAAGVQVDEFGCEIMKVVAPEPVEVSIELAVNFATNSSLIAAEYLSEIQAVAMFMDKYPDTSVVVEGHTDDTGRAEYNQWLSARRAASVANVLVDTFGIASDRVTSKGFGESAPLVANDSAENRAVNRRVVAVIKTVE
ncbi:MAG TPA: OmpA family protein [Pseudomonadales bacterium]|nr:OmpA family protein [Pseudomonadales bacterium]